MQGLTHNGGVKEKLKYSCCNYLQEGLDSEDSHDIKEDCYDLRMLKLIEIQHDPRRVGHMEIIFNFYAIGKLNVYTDKDKINYKKRKKKQFILLCTRISYIYTLICSN